MPADGPSKCEDELVALAYRLTSITFTFHFDFDFAYYLRLQALYDA